MKSTIINKTVYEPYDYECDICGEPESKVGNLYVGRIKSGQDYQICRYCKREYELETLQDIEDYFNNVVG